MKYWIPLFFVLLAWGLFPADRAHAQAEANRVALGVTVSAVTPTDGTLFGDKISMDRIALPEVSLTYFISKSFALEVSHGSYTSVLESKTGKFEYGDLEVSPTRLTLQYRQNFGQPKPYWDVSSAYFAVGGDYFSTDF